MITRRLQTMGLVSLFSFMMVASATTIAAQSKPSTGDNPPASEKRALASQIITAGDVLAISIFGVPELAQEVRVAGNGKAQLSLLGNTPVAGLTEEEAADMIARELRDRNFMVHPQVKVAIKDSATQGVSVLGEVQHPGVYQLTGPRTLLDLLSMAGGLTNTADAKVTIKHRAGTEETLVVSFKSEDVRGALNMNAQVYPGDLILVPRAGIVYVLGDVGRPGGFVMQDQGKITLLQALAEAGSPLATASANSAVLLRKVDEKYTVSKLHVDKIARGQEHDIELTANDIVYIPNARLKSALRSSTSIAATAASVSTVAIYGVMH
jgi:polysaccharide biosynthesis/export protein